ncbi:MAG: large-conductance mechanosensitive channel protein MscL [Candidatus Omnitrophica bacterium]|nr:large-conductance mechanosensitive channel protein MscL [Candidatus Omnitrophota bacterium]
MKFVEEFKQFALKGNVMDMAVGIIIGASFGKIVDSAVKDVMMPPLGFLMGGVDFSNQEWVIRSAQGTTPAVTLKYGLFLNALVSFAIVAFTIFLLVKGINALKKKEEASPTLPPNPTKEELLLTEIRDLLKKK